MDEVFAGLSFTGKLRQSGEAVGNFRSIVNQALCTLKKHQ
jgi:hypothetical protein